MIPSLFIRKRSCFLVAPIKEPLAAGKFYLQNFISYDTTKQVIKGKEVFVESDQFIGLDQHLLKIEPARLESGLLQGAATTHVLQVENLQGEQLYIRIEAEEVATDYDRSLFEHLELELRGEAELALEPRGRARSIILVRAPRDVKPGGYYGKINVRVFSTAKEHLETFTVPFSVLLGREWERSATPRSLAVELVDQEYLISAVIANTGDVHLSPRGRLELRDEDNDVVAVFNLDLAEGAGELLPEMNGFLLATVNRANMPPGNYLATVLVLEEQEQVGIAEFPLQIEDKEDTHAAL